MTQYKSNSHKSTPKKLSDQVLAILHAKGLSKVFNYTDYLYFKNNLLPNTFDKANRIADFFISFNADVASDFEEYVF